MLVIWLICAFGLISQTNTITANSTQAAITATSSAIEIDSSDAISDLDKAETKDAKKLEIIKQIRRVNNDGSYTVGYESVDGTFKIESRDVLGNVKGTYGYVDENGEIKRVSYTVNNSTGTLKSSPQPFEQAATTPGAGRSNRTVHVSTTTRKPPSIAYLMSSTPSPLVAQLRANAHTVQQVTPKRRILLASSSQMPNKNPFSSSSPTSAATTTTRKMELSTETSSTTNTHKTDPTTTIVYATSIRSTVKPTTTPAPNLQQHPNSKIEISDRFSKVLNMNNNNNNLKILDDTNEQSDTKSERKQLRGNALRRQLSSDQSENFETHSQIVYSQSSDEDSVHTYSGVTGTQRPVFSTTNSPRIPALVLAARNRAAALKNAALQQTAVTTEKMYAKPPRRKSERRDESTTTTEQSSDNEYLTQSPVPVQMSIPPANRDVTQNENLVHVYRHQAGFLPRTREYLHQSQSSNPLENNHSNNNNNNNNNINNNGARSFKQVHTGYVQNDAENEQYLRETSESSSTASTTPEHYTNSDLNAAAQPILHPYHPRNQRVYGSVGAQPGLRPNNVNDYDQRLQQQQSIPLPVQPGFYGGGQIGSPYYNNYFDRPLTARDFERLLNLLVVRHQQYQRYNYLPGLMGQNPFGGGFGYGGFGYGGFGGFNPNPYRQIGRPPLYNQFDPRYTAFSRSLPPVPPPNNFLAPYSEQENMYQAQNPIEQQLPYTGRIPQARRNFNSQPFYGAGEPDLAHHKVIAGGTAATSAAETGTEYLPSEVREELLFRMLMLAIQPDNGASNFPIPVPDASTIQEYFNSNFKNSIPATVAVAAAATTTAPDQHHKKPVRSVQILGEEMR